MVAVPGVGETPVLLGSGIGMTMPKMQCKISLRSGNQDAWRRWLVNRNDVITAHGLDALMDNQLMPTLEVIGERFPKLSSAERQEMLVSSSKQYLGSSRAGGAVDEPSLTPRAAVLRLHLVTATPAALDP